MMSLYRFEWNERLQIRLPVLELDWESYEVAEQLAIIEQWELIRGNIPDRIMAFEQIIRVKQERLGEEECFDASCILNEEIAEYASRINDLHIWYRIDQQMDSRRHL
jgi:hypothetical protein